MIDLHVHSKASDGILSPEELVIHYKKNGVEIMSLTDHDSINGIDAAFKKAKEINIQLISGVELSIDYSGGDFHLLGYGIDIKNKNLISFLNKFAEERKKRSIKIIKFLQDQGYNVTFAQLEIMFPKTSSFGKPHIARLLLERNYIQSIDEAFKELLKDSSIGGIRKKKVSLESALNIISDAGGVPVIAHPASLNLSYNEFEKIIKKFIMKGLKGIEVFASMHSLEDVNFFYSIAKKYDLIITGGSDFHGDKNEKPGYYNNKKIPDVVRDFAKRLIK